MWHTCAVFYSRSMPFLRATRSRAVRVMDEEHGRHRGYLSRSPRAGPAVKAGLPQGTFTNTRSSGGVRSLDGLIGELS